MSPTDAVLSGKTLEGVQDFRKLVLDTLKDVEGRGGADPLLRGKLADMAQDIDLVQQERVSADTHTS